MFKRLLAAGSVAFALLISAVGAQAQTACPKIVDGAVLTAAQWNSCFTAKQDTLGYIPLNSIGGVISGRLSIAAPTGSRANFNLTPGSVPPSPSDGDIWVSSTAIQARVNGATVNLLSPDITSITGLGTGVATALGVNVGSAGAIVVNGGALGTPSSGVATNLTGTAAGLTAGNVTTNANLTGDVTSAGNASAIPISSLTDIGTPSATLDWLMIDDHVSGTKKKVNPSEIVGAAAVASLNGQTGNVVLKAPRSVRGLSGSATASTLTVAADAVTFVDQTTSLALTVSPVSSASANITVAFSAGGRDQSNPFASGATVNFFWIAQPGGASPSLIASTASSTTGPTLPSGYSMWAYATTLVMSGSNLQLVAVRGASVYYNTFQVVLSLGTATTETAVSLASAVPANALSTMIGGDYNNAAAAPGTYNAAIRVVTGSTFYNVALGVSGAGVSANVPFAITIPNVGQNFFYLNTVNTTRFTVSVLGYIVPN